MPKRVLFLIPYPLEEYPSQRFRFEQYFDILKEHGMEIRVHSFLNSRNGRIFYGPGRLFLKAWSLLAGFMARATTLVAAPFYDFIFIHREATPLGPPIFEWIIAMVMRRKIIYDFDDAIWATDRKHESWLLKTMKWRNKVKAICKWSYKVSCGNEYLCSFAKKYNDNVVYNPTTIDTKALHNPDLHHRRESSNHVIIGWTGSHSTLKYLNEIIPVLQTLEEQFPTLEILIIADRKPDVPLKSLRFIPWSTQHEISDLLRIDIGIMPLPDDEWSRGKCGFKALQYMALAIPAVASPVGVNTTIIDDGVNGFLCSSPEEWIHALSKLLQNVELRKQMGDQGKKNIINRYSVASNSSNFLSLFE